MNDDICNVVFDLGGVLIDWNPRYLYRKIFTSSETVEFFLSDVCNHDWNILQDGGRSFDEAINERTEKFPNYASEIKAYHERWEEMLGGPIDDSVAILNKIKQSGRYRLLALTNWSQETFPIAEKRFAFLKTFEGIVVSGKIKMKKPDAEIYHHLCKVHSVVPEQSLFIDDSLPNVTAAKKIGFKTIHFQTPDSMLAEMQKLGLAI